MPKPNNPDLISFIEVPREGSFPIQNLPYGVFQRKAVPLPFPHVGVAIGDQILDLTVLESRNLLTLPEGGARDKIFDQGCLNPLMALPPAHWSAIRNQISVLLRHDNPTLRDNAPVRQEAFIAQRDATMMLPVRIGDYTDFYSSKEHATNVGKMFRDKDNPLLPNWRHLPVGYHGRASSIVIGGTPIRRPIGQILPHPPEPQPILAACRRLDFEVELGGIIGNGNALGSPISIDQAEAHLFGMVLVNDWSARDIQQWEYVPLGPFVSKSFATTISPWVVTVEALAPFRCPAPLQDPQPLGYLRQNHAGYSHFDITLTAKIFSRNQADALTICTTNSKYQYWSIAQQIAHHTITGCNLTCGDLLASGTISGSEPGSYGSLLELSWGGRNSVKINRHESRTFLEDGDTVTIEGFCQATRYRIGFGAASGQIFPAREIPS